MFSKNRFESIARQKSTSNYTSTILNENRKFSRSASTTSIFLSHSHKDKEFVKFAKVFFENLGMNIYVDWADETMPESTNGITAQKIKNQIISVNDKFILLATNEALASRWCNWEVGIADPFKLPNDKIALLPLIENSGAWNGNEYLQIYPYIKESLTSTGEYYIWYPNGECKNLKTWLKG